MSRAVEESMCLVLSYFVCGLKLKAQIGYSGIGNVSLQPPWTKLY